MRFKPKLPWFMDVFQFPRLVLRCTRWADVQQLGGELCRREGQRWVDPPQFLFR